jgi:hypothetical protein
MRIDLERRRLRGAAPALVVPSVAVGDAAAPGDCMQTGSLRLIRREDAFVADAQIQARPRPVDTR